MSCVRKGLMAWQPPLILVISLTAQIIWNQNIGQSHISCLSSNQLYLFFNKRAERTAIKKLLYKKESLVTDTIKILHKQTTNLEVNLNQNKIFELTKCIRCFPTLVSKPGTVYIELWPMKLFSILKTCSRTNSFVQNQRWKDWRPVSIRWKVIYINSVVQFSDIIYSLLHSLSSNKIVCFRAFMVTIVCYRKELYGIFIALFLSSVVKSILITECVLELSNSRNEIAQCQNFRYFTLLAHTLLNASQI